MDYEKIKKVSEKKGFTLSKLAQTIGVSPSSLLRSINVKSMNVNTLEQISKVLQVSIYTFFDDDSEDIAAKKIQDLENQIEEQKIKNLKLQEEKEIYMRNFEITAESERKLRNEKNIVSMVYSYVANKNPNSEPLKQLEKIFSLTGKYHMLQFLEKVDSLPNDYVKIYSELRKDSDLQDLFVFVREELSKFYQPKKGDFSL